MQSATGETMDLTDIPRTEKGARTRARSQAATGETIDITDTQQPTKARSRSPIRRTGDVKISCPRTIDAWYNKSSAEIIAQASARGVGLYMDMSRRPIPQKEWENIEKQNERLNVKTTRKTAVAAYIDYR